MTNFVKREQDASEAFQKKMNVFGLTVDNCRGGSYNDDSTAFFLTLQTKQEPVKGNKELIERLEAAGYHVNKYMMKDKNGRGYYVFRAWEVVTLECREDDADEYVPESQKSETASRFEYINTGRAVTLANLVQSEDVSDKTMIQIFDNAGGFITKGNWFQDNILGFNDREGVATKAGTGLTVNFTLKATADETDEAIDLLLGGDGLANVLENMAEQLKIEAVGAASLMNQQAKEGDVLRNHTNYGTMTQALRTLHHMGYDTMNATWGDGDMLICEKITVNGATIYERQNVEVRA